MGKGIGRFYSYYKIILERNKENYSEIELTHYSQKYNKTRTIKPSSARENKFIQTMKNLMTELHISKLEVKLKE